MHSINNVDDGITHPRPSIPDVPFHPGPTYRPPPKPIRSNVPKTGHQVIGQLKKIGKIGFHTPKK